MLTGISFQGVGPGWAEKAVAQLEADIKAGAVGVGEIGKGLGLTTKKADGTRLEARRSGSRSGVGCRRSAECSDLHPHGGSARVLQPARFSRTSGGSSSRCSRIDAG